MADYYKILGIDRDASNDEIKTAYRRLAHKYHPDKNPGDTAAEERFKQIQWAYECLTGRKKPGRISPTVFYRRQYPPSFFKNEHPFLSFYWAMKTYGDRIMKNRKLFRQGENEK